MQHDRGYWQQHVRAHCRSRRTQSAYCLQHGLHPKTYRTWSRRLEAEGDLEPSSAAWVGARGSVWHLHTNYVAMSLDAERHELAAWIRRRFQGDRVLLIYHHLAAAHGLASVEALLHGGGVAAETP